MKEPNLHDIKDEQIISKEDGKVLAGPDIISGHLFLTGK